MLKTIKFNLFRNKKTIALLILLISLGCKSIQKKQAVNQIINKQKQGIWIQVDTLNYIYKIVGKYINNQEVGTWKYYNNDKLVRKEKYKNNTCKTKFYHKNGKLFKKGFTEYETKKDSIHWYYFGKWKTYNEQGQLIETIKYIKGVPQKY
jgi:antitoxin component YwqK of YwqJK toxin-antitoxin module